MRNKTQRLKSKLWKVFSQYIRKKYADQNGIVECVSCGKKDHWKEMDSGHYIPKSVSLSLMFDERNVHPQCTGCNRFRHGNLTTYALALQKKYGLGILEELDSQRHKITKISVSEYEELIKKYLTSTKENF